jgi:hypothetical protein
MYLDIWKRTMEDYIEKSIPNFVFKIEPEPKG